MLGERKSIFGDSLFELIGERRGRQTSTMKYSRQTPATDSQPDTAYMFAAMDTDVHLFPGPRTRGTSKTKPSTYLILQQ